ncbi:uncharacterized protein SPPG_01457 [Spizellomyces punctatus DAOM BR117]|uniref:CSN8/PSMD8/EIF3K domain-containing protein n=1 Tax=Spizellomyces punctatus (strain DAOM BR117) TaxID=645134 RepID=A0A0L0HSY0_SPIPD|nr:uncharacterized protein SPPG_01457 [Spizellomyces punctatus DAOM BR117]KND04010.1 hypothetical protein SPPG_01457 [Spizellomyces punctatus DAOM BR117]|eukprot:XP_016612049.1 hypothetical protein SPPG_01457 [Spizellomyces punctatus DAOM BR117]
MDEIYQCISKGDIPQLIALAEDLELRNSLVLSSPMDGPAGAVPSGNEPSLYSVLQLAHLIQNDLPAARLVAKRTPRDQQTPEFAAVTTVASHLWNRDLPSVYSAMASTQWSSILEVLVLRLRNAVQERTFALIANSYESISAVDAAALLGLGAPAEAMELAAKSGWDVDQAGGWLRPPGAKGDLRQHQGLANGKSLSAQGPGLEDVGSLAKMIVHLESF